MANFGPMGGGGGSSGSRSFEDSPNSAPTEPEDLSFLIDYLFDDVPLIDMPDIDWADLDQVDWYSLDPWAIDLTDLFEAMLIEEQIAVEKASIMLGDYYFPWYNPFGASDIAEQLEERLFLGVADPYGGGFRHATASALLAEKYGPLANVMIWGWDLHAERQEPVGWNNITDMWAEQVGLAVGARSSFPAEAAYEVYNLFPNDDMASRNWGNVQPDTEKLKFMIITDSKTGAHEW